MEKVEIALPAPLAKLVKEQPIDSVIAFKRAAFLLYAYIDSEMCSFGGAANLLGMERFDLIDFYGSYGIPYVRADKDFYFVTQRKELAKMNIFSPPPLVLSLDEIKRRVVPLCAPNGMTFLLLFGDFAKAEIPMNAEEQLNMHIHFLARFEKKTIKQYDDAKYSFESILGRNVDLLTDIPKNVGNDTFYDTLHREIKEGIILYDCRGA